MGISQIPGVGPTNAAVANAVAASLPTATNIQNLATSFGNLPTGVPNWTLQQTLVNTSNNVSVPNATVYAVVASGGGPSVIFNSSNNTDRRGGQGGTVVFGIVPASTRVLIGGSDSPSSYGSLVASPPNRWNRQAGTNSLITFPPNGNVASPGGFGADASMGDSTVGGSLATGGGGLGAGQGGTPAGTVGGNSTFGYSGGNAGANHPSYGGGGGGGAGIAGNGGTGGSAIANDYGRGGVGGVGGGGAGGDGRNGFNNSWPTSYPNGSANGGQGAVLLYY